MFKEKVVLARTGVSGHTHQRWSPGVQRRLTNQHQEQQKAESGGEGNSHVRPVNASNAVVTLTLLHGHVIDAKHLGTAPRFLFHSCCSYRGGLSPQPRALTVTAFFLFAVFPADHNPSDDLVLSRKMNSTLYHRSQKWSRKQNSAQT